MSKDIEEIARAICWSQARRTAIECEVNENDTPDFDDISEECREHYLADAQAAYSVMEKRLGELEGALNKCRAIIKFHVKPERCVSIGDDVISARAAFEEAVTALNNESKPVENGHG